ncbi:MAG: glucosaminidase domain-containing protein [Actinomycetota bacterium]
MSTRRSSPFAVALVALGLIVGSGAAPAGAAASAASTTTTTAAPPPPFGLSTDAGLELVLRQQAAQADLGEARADLGAARRERAAARLAEQQAATRLRRLGNAIRATQARVDRSRANLASAAARAYVEANGGRVVAAISSVLGAESAVDVASQLHIISEYGSSERVALRSYLGERARLERQRAAARDLRARVNARVRRADETLLGLRTRIQDAARVVAETKLGIEAFHAAATSASSPILGPSRLSANQMAAFVVANGGRPRITVPLVHLAQMFIAEGKRVGVRGDVAFAQSILETGSFAHPGDAPTDNNFSGIGWCDSCRHGYNFVDARTGVRAQVQLLRVYVDPEFPAAEFPDPILLPGTLRLGFRGEVENWWDLWGTWATGALYGQRVYDLYERMVAFAAGVPRRPAPKVARPTPYGPDSVTRPPGTGPGSRPTP